MRYPGPEIDDGCFGFHFELFISLLAFSVVSDIYTDTIVTFSPFFSHIRCTIRRAQTHPIALAPHQEMANGIIFANFLELELIKASKVEFSAV